MDFGVSLLFYLVMGGAMAVAALMRRPRLSLGNKLIVALTTLLFWPLSIPLLLSPVAEDEENSCPQASAQSDPVSAVERELRIAVAGLGRWAGPALNLDPDRISELARIWREQAARIAEMDAILQASAGDLFPGPQPASSEVAGPEQARRTHLSRLRQVRQRTQADLDQSLARVRELVSLIHLSRFTGEPAERADELLREIAASVESLTEVVEWA